VQREAAVVDGLAEYRRAVSELLATVAAWNWDDPVSLIYRQLFVSNVIVDPPFDRGDLLEELRFRQEHRIPPGYKDSSNEYSGVGDLLIWKALLDIGKQTSRDVVFVSGDEKTDWRYQSENTALYPRFELLQEYRAISGGRSLLIISFAQLLEQFGVPTPVVEEVRKEEAVAALSMPSEGNIKPYTAAIRAEAAVMRWLLGRFPRAEIHSKDGYVDFVVTRENRVPEAFGIKYIPGSEVYLRQFRPWADRIRHEYLFKRSMIVNLVVVVDDAESAEEIMRRAPFNLELGMGIAGVIVGTLTEDDAFVVRQRVRFDEAAHLAQE
jgi:PIN like domain